MPNVTVNPIQRINVRVNQTANRPTVSSTSTFVGASDQQAQIDYAVTTANNALQTASQALITANNFLIPYFTTGSWQAALAFLTVATFLNIVVYYLHERAWNMISWGKNESEQ